MFLILISGINDFKFFTQKYRENIVSNKETGVVKFFNGQKGYGFITPDAGGNDLFVHASNIVEGTPPLNEHSKVEFDRGNGKKGPEAVNVARI